ncbi:MAG: type 2 isopentenyl-diphosphate Delta-isomerase [Candidatus Methanomethylicus sp.]|nr:type 2 isopentenyl-diphosphate Delta-isomerase [Candidatus Methanomethylicus sp.]
MISDRKLSHLEICRDRNVGSRGKPTHLADVELIHCAMPELNIDDVKLSANLFGKSLRAPVLISAMTGGHPATKKVNENLAKAADELGLGICIGSQRAAIEDSRMEDSFRIVREVSDKLLVIGNIGAAQLLDDNAVNIAERSLAMVDADALAVHLNPLQELVQPEGDTRYKGILKNLKKIVKSLKKPVMVKETGCGISREVARSLASTSIAAIDISGVGGTSWAAVEHYNAQLRGDKFKSEVADTMWDWGIPTAMAVCEVASLGCGIPIIASGGINNGLDMAKCIALGASYVGVARPILLQAFESHIAVSSKLERMVHELIISTLLTGCKSVEELQRVPKVIGGDLLNWVNQRGLAVVKGA